MSAWGADSGAGKTTLALHFLQAGGRACVRENAVFTVRFQKPPRSSGRVRIRMDGRYRELRLSR
jgi:hypothetical protein